MELVSYEFNEQELVIAPLGDFQWSGHYGPTATESLRSHIDYCLERGARFVGMGDYTDFMSPSNRQRLVGSGLYDTAQEVIENAAIDLAREVYTELLLPTTGRWLGLIEGHHFFQLANGTTTDTYLANKLHTRQLGTSALVRVCYGAGHEIVFYVHHGKGGGVTPGAPLNTLDRVAHGWTADVILMGHTTKTPATKFARIEPRWHENGAHELVHKEVILVNTGGFSKSSIVGSQHAGVIPRGDYAETAMYVPSPLSAPLLYLRKDGSVRVEL